MKNNLKKLLVLATVATFANTVVVATNNAVAEKDGFVTKGMNWADDHRTATVLGATALVAGVAGLVLHQKARRSVGASTKYAKIAYAIAALAAAGFTAEVAFNATDKLGFGHKVTKAASALALVEKATTPEAKKAAQEKADKAIEALAQVKLEENKREKRAMDRLKAEEQAAITLALAAKAAAKAATQGATAPAQEAKPADQTDANAAAPAPAAAQEAKPAAQTDASAAANNNQEKAA